MMWHVILYGLAIVVGGGIIFAWCWWIERLISLRRHCYPMVHSVHWLRRAVVREINAHYPDMKTALEIGSGYGGLARQMARRCHMHVDALENMPMSAWISRCGDWITGADCQTHLCDAFDYLSACAPVDVAVAYMGPGTNEQIAQYRNKFRVLITLDAPVATLNPTRTVDVGHGYTRYALGRVKMPHRLFIYEFEK